MEHFSQRFGTPLALLRLNYAVEMRYGVLVDLASRVRAGEPVDLRMGSFNVIWQGDASAAALAALGHASAAPFIVNIAGPETVSVRRACEALGGLMQRPPTFQGEEAPDALLSDGSLGHRLFGYPRVPLRALLEWTADWVRRGGASLGKPTHFEARDGRF